MKENGIELVFQVSDRLADCRLRDKQLFRSFIEATFLIDGFEDADFVSFKMSGHADSFTFVVSACNFIRRECAKYRLSRACAYDS